MNNRNLLTKILTITGTILVWFPIIAPILLSLAVIITDREILFDYLMPAELFPFVLAGGALLTWASLRVPRRWKLISWGLGTAIGFLIFSQGFAVITGLASGATEPGGWQWALVLAMLVGYILAVIVAGVGGALLWHDLFKPPLKRSV